MATQAYRLKSGTHWDGKEKKLYRPGEIVITEAPLDQKWPNRFECILVRRRAEQPEVNTIIYDDELSPEEVAKLGDIPVEEVEEPEVPEETPEVSVKLVKRHIKTPPEKRGWWVYNAATDKPVNDSPLTRAEAIEMERGV